MDLWYINFGIIFIIQEEKMKKENEKIMNELIDKEIENKNKQKRRNFFIGFLVGAVGAIVGSKL